MALLRVFDAVDLLTLLRVQHCSPKSEVLPFTVLHYYGIVLFVLCAKKKSSEAIQAAFANVESLDQSTCCEFISSRRAAKLRL